MTGRIGAPQKIAVVHDWLVDFGGAERVLEQILAAYPSADLFTLFDRLPDRFRDRLQGKTATTSFLHRLPGLARHYRSLLPLMPLAVEQLDVRGYDLVISSCHALIKGIVTGPDQTHLCYIHTPTRFVWDFDRQYQIGHGPVGWLKRLMLHRLRVWDFCAAARVDAFIANSAFVARRVRKAYRRSAEVIPPPVELARFQQASARGEDYLVVARLVPQKCVEVVVDAFAQLPERRLVVVGSGPELWRLQRRASANVSFLGWISDLELADRLACARALVTAAIEDFGITMVEALACGTPVIAPGLGGAREIVRDLDQDRPTGVLFHQPTPAGVVEAVARFERAGDRIDPLVCRAAAEPFGPERFRAALVAAVERAIAARDGDENSER